MSKYYPVDILRHFAPLVLISGLDVPQDDEHAHFYNWTHYTTQCSINESSISQHPFLHTTPTTNTPFTDSNFSGERLVNAGEPNASLNPQTAANLFYSFAARSSAFDIWNPAVYEVSRKTASYLLNIQFTASRSDFILPPPKTSRFSFSGSNASTSTLESYRPESGQAAANQSPNSLDENQQIHAQPPKTHSALSPLNPSSSLYPDSLISVQWVQKYLLLTPCLFISVLSIDTTYTSREDQQKADDTLAIKINQLRSQLSNRNIKIMVILVSDVSPIQDPTLNHRIYYLSKNTGLIIGTTLFFLPPPRTAGNIDIETLAETVCQLAFGNAQEFYSNVTIRIQRRGQLLSTGNPLTDKARIALLDHNLTVTPLSHAGWQVRYQYKLAVMAEFRQELENAIRGYEYTYEAALELFEATHPLTETCTPQRWQEFRAFLDLVAYKIVKLYFYMGQGNLAYRKYQFHINSVEAVLKQKGFDLESHQVVIWRASLEQLVAELMDMTEGMLVEHNCPVAMDSNIMVPGGNLPRAGYWYLNASTKLIGLVRSKLKQEGDKSNANQKFLNDPYFEQYNPDYLVFTSKYMLNKAIKDFESETLGNEHSVAAASYQLGEAFFLSGEYNEAHQHYTKAAKTYRSKKWYSLLGIVLQQLVKTTGILGNTEEQLLAGLELAINKDKCLGLFGSSEVDENFGKSNSISGLSYIFDSLDISDTHNMHIKLNEKPNLLKFYDCSFAFYSPKPFLGLPTQLQLTLNCVVPKYWYSEKSKNSFFMLQQIVIKIKGKLGSIKIKHNPKLKQENVVKINATELKISSWPVDHESAFASLSSSTSTITQDTSQLKLDLAEKGKSKPHVDEKTIYECEANLHFEANKMRVFQISQIPKQLGEAKFLHVSATTKHKNMVFEMNMIPQPETSGTIPWYFEREKSSVGNSFSQFSFSKSIDSSQNDRISATHIWNSEPHRLKVLSRPSRISVTMDTSNELAVGEQVHTKVHIFNGEQENVIANVQVKAVTDKGDSARAYWLPCTKTKSVPFNDVVEKIELGPQQDVFKAVEFHVPNTGGTFSSLSISFSVTYYPIGTEPFETQKQNQIREISLMIKDVTSFSHKVFTPFAVYSDVRARVHPNPWPSMFDPDVDENLALSPKIWKRWELTNVLQCTVGAGSLDRLQVVKTELEIEPISEDTTASGTSSVKQSYQEKSVSFKEADMECNIVSKLDCQNKTLADGDNEKFSYIFDAARKTNDHDIRGSKLKAKIKIFWKRVSANDLLENKSNTTGSNKEDENGNDGNGDEIVNVYKVPTIWPTVLLIVPRLIVTLKPTEVPSSKHSGSLPFYTRPFKLTYYIENSTFHTLTYNVTMGPSDAFAFQGPGQLTVRVLPFSRRALQYMVLMLPQNDTNSDDSLHVTRNKVSLESNLILPQLRVYDVSFKRVLSQIPASKWLKSEKGQLMLSV